MWPETRYFFGRQCFTQSGLGFHYRQQLFGLLSAEVAFKYDHEFVRAVSYGSTYVQQAGGFSLPIRLQLQTPGKAGLNLGAGYAVSKGVYAQHYFNCERIYYVNPWQGLAWQYGLHLYAGVFYQLNQNYQLRVEADFAPYLTQMGAVNTTEIQFTCFRRLKAKTR
ncbi:MAG: hypothetical protein ACK417_09310 [Bacteroidia bacterium]